VKLRYLPDAGPGYGRMRKGKGYCYVDSDGKRVTDPDELSRFNTLRIPPAWKDVWISPSPRGHLQATGVDQEGRKQYLYHPDWTRERQQQKLHRMLAFGRALPEIRRRMRKDFRREIPTKEKTSATALKVTEATLIRIGNEQYRKRYGSHGLTTLRKKHVRINGPDISFRFKGKKGVWHELSIRDAALASTLEALADMRGGYLFQYIDETGKRRRLRAADLNEYIQGHTGDGFSSKDYRTWYAGLWAFRLLAKCPDYADTKACQATVLSVVDAVSERLGNTRSVCKQYYIPDRLLTAFEDGTLLPYLRSSRNGNGQPTKKETEQQFLRFLQDISGEQ